MVLKVRIKEVSILTTMKLQVRPVIRMSSHLADIVSLAGCEKPNVNCYPLKWKTVFEYYEEAGISWQVYQDTNNFDDNPLAWFEQYQKAPRDSPLSQKGLAFLGLDAFYEAAGNGTLPQISFIVGPMELSEHPPYMPKDGGWLQQQVVNAVVNGPKYSSTVLMISYDGNVPLSCGSKHLQLTVLRIRRIRRSCAAVPLSSRHTWRMAGGSPGTVRTDLRWSWSV